MSDITIRHARPTDGDALRELALLDSRHVPTGDVLLAEVCGELVAAASPAGVIADPFRRTADVVALLELRSHGGRRASRTARRPVRARLRLA
jgi:hypothetical protein